MRSRSSDHPIFGAWPYEWLQTKRHRAMKHDKQWRALQRPTETWKIEHLPQQDTGM